MHFLTRYTDEVMVVVLVDWMLVAYSTLSTDSTTYKSMDSIV